MEWLHELPDGEDKRTATVDAAYEVARKDPRQALDLAEALSPGPQRDELLVYGISQWAAADSDAAFDWAGKLPESALQQRLFAAAAIAVAERDPAEAARMAAMLAPGVEQDRAAVAVVQRWAQESPLDAAGWVSAFPDSPVRTAALQNLMSIWMAQDKAAAESWLHDAKIRYVANFDDTPAPVPVH
jgi:hypothetical protein